MLKTIILLLTLSPVVAFACPTDGIDGERGLHWSCSDDTLDETTQVNSVPTDRTPSESPPEPIDHQQPELNLESERRDDPCTHKETWESHCGFVNPGGNFLFFSIQAEKLEQNMVMNAEDAEATKQYQRLHQWAITQAIQVAENWEFNRMNGLDWSDEMNGMSRFGLRLYRQSQALKQQALFEAVKKEGGLLLWFTRADCAYCHHTASVYTSIHQETGIPLVNVSILGDCILSDEEQYDCGQGEKAMIIAQLAAVDVTPALYVYIPHDAEIEKKGKNNAQFIAINKGVETTDRIVDRLYRFLAMTQHSTMDMLEKASQPKP